jgi:hypothetical protein
MRAEKFRTFDADGPKTKTGAFSGAGDYTYVADHKASFVIIACIITISAEEIPP